MEEKRETLHFSDDSEKFDSEVILNIYDKNKNESENKDFEVRIMNKKNLLNDDIIANNRNHATNDEFINKDITSTRSKSNLFDKFMENINNKNKNDDDNDNYNYDNNKHNNCNIDINDNNSSSNSFNNHNDNNDDNDDKNNKTILNNNNNNYYNYYNNNNNNDYDVKAINIQKSDIDESEITRSLVSPRLNINGTKGEKKVYDTISSTPLIAVVYGKELPDLSGKILFFKFIYDYFSILLST